MKKTLVISVPQLFSMLFINRLVVEITYSRLMSGGNYFMDNVLSAIISFILVFVLITPIYYLFKMDQSMNVIDNSYESMGKIGGIIAGIYAIYFIFICVHTIALFKVFLSNVINPSVSTEVLLTAMAIFACYGAYKGVEGLARASGIIIFFMILAIFFIGIFLLNTTDPLNFDPFLYNGTSSLFGGVLFMVSRSSSIPALAVLLPMAKGNVKKGIILWNTSIFSLIIVSVLLMIGSMGDFLKTQMFPVYTAASIAKIGSLQHLDALYLGIWTMGIFIKLSLFLMLSGECIKKIIGERVGKLSILIFGATVMLLGIFINKNAILTGVFSSEYLLAFMLLTGVIIPLACIALKRKSIKKEGTINEI